MNHFCHCAIMLQDLMKRLILAALLCVTACSGDTAAVGYTLTPPATPGGRLCTTQCSEARDYCGESCDLQYRQCIIQIQSQALHDYDQYTVQQFASHSPIELRVSDFERTSTCDEVKKDCTGLCDRHHRSCYADCGGAVNESTTCQFLCF